MDNQDLNAIGEEINKRKAAVVEQPQDGVPQIAFPQTPTTPQQAKDQATQLVEQAFGQAIVNEVLTNDNVQKKLLDSAGHVIDNKLEAIKAQAEQEDKQAHFNNKKGACECFGYNETTTEKWAVNGMNIWHNIATAIWILIGCFTFAPVVFVAKKIVVIFKKTWLAVLIAILIYLIVIAAPFVVDFLIEYYKGGTGNV